MEDDRIEVTIGENTKVQQLDLQSQVYLKKKKLKNNSFSC